MLSNKLCTFSNKNSFEHSMRNLFNLKFERFMGPLPYNCKHTCNLAFFFVKHYNKETCKRAIEDLRSHTMQV